MPDDTRTIDLGARGPAAASRPTRDAIYRGKIVGREVVTHPLDAAHYHGKLDDAEHAAGNRLRAAMEGSWPAGRTTARPMYVSDPGEHDEPDEPETEEERATKQRAFHRDKLEARRIIGERHWIVVAHVCAGGAVVSEAALTTLRAGLKTLAATWKSEPQKNV